MRPLKKLNGIVTINDENIETIDSKSRRTISPSADIIVSPVNNERIVQNYRLIWLDRHLDERDNDDFTNFTFQLRQIINSLKKFTDIDQCIELIETIKEEKIFMICSGELGQKIIPVIHPFNQINSIYIFCENEQWYENWTKEYIKIKGVFTNMTLICEALKNAVTDYDHNAVPFSLVKTTDGASKQNLDLLDKSFMYTQILKEILLSIDFEQEHIKEFLSYCRSVFFDNTVEHRHINKIEREYHDHGPVWWYTYQSFLYSMLNRALRLMEVDIIIKMGFFLKDVHHHLVELHSKQFTEHHDSQSFTLYRGQGLSQTDFIGLQQTQGGLLSFNNFLSTSTNRAVSLDFARTTINTSDLVGVLFVIQINPSISTTPFANVKNVSYYKGEDEILFSMHSIFRIGQIKQLDEDTRLWQVDLILTSDNDPQLQALTEQIRKETFPHAVGWERLGNLLIKLGQFDKAEQVCDILLNQATDERDKGVFNHMLGRIKYNQGKYEDAVQYYEQALNIHQKLLSPTHTDIASSCNNLGAVYTNMEEHSTALSYYEKALEILKKTLPENDPRLGISYSNIGEVYMSMGDYLKALSFHEKAIEIKQKTLADNHPSLAASYNNIGKVYNNLRQYSKGLSYVEKALEILKKTLPENHPHLATSYSNVAWVYEKMGDYGKALQYYERALYIRQSLLPPDHPDIKILKEIIESVKTNM